MSIKLDAKTLIIGIVAGIVLTIAVGAGVGSADADRFGISIQNQGSALVKTQDGSFFIVNAKTGMATRVILHDSLNADPDDTRKIKGALFNFSDSYSRDRSKR